MPGVTSQAAIGLGTRDEAQKVFPAFAPGLGELPEVGPGRYNVPPSVGRQPLSHQHTAGKAIIGTESRFNVSVRSITYVTVLVCLLRSAFLFCWGTECATCSDSSYERGFTDSVGSLLRYSPGPVYTPKVDFKSGSYVVSPISFGTSERKPTLYPDTPVARYDVRSPIGRDATVRFASPTPCDVVHCLSRR